jgi:hypothetical protein
VQGLAPAPPVCENKIRMNNPKNAIIARRVRR